MGLLEYVPFIILLLALFTISGGVRLTGALVGTPIVNLTIIAIGTLLASWMGTTGAAMLLIRPLINANKHRKNKDYNKMAKVEKSILSKIEINVKFF